uniref:Uncharacterized protein n=1 Tax=Rhizophora mucronata TaxID=61149 RepID=A0A2P2N313_RHIMU
MSIACPIKLCQKVGTQREENMTHQYSLDTAA